MSLASSSIEVARKLARVALRALLLAALAMTALACVLGASAYALAGRGGSPGRAALGAVIAALLVIACAPLVALERAIAGATAYAIEALGLGRRLVALFLDGLAEKSRASGFQLERDGEDVASRLNDAKQGFLVARVRRRLLDQIRTLTLESARGDGGRVDLPPVRARLEGYVDAQLARRVRFAVVSSSTAYVAAAVVAGLVVAWLLGQR